MFQVVDPDQVDREEAMLEQVVEVEASQTWECPTAPCTSRLVTEVLADMVLALVRNMHGSGNIQYLHVDVL